MLPKELLLGPSAEFRSLVKTVSLTCTSVTSLLVITLWWLCEGEESECGTLGGWFVRTLLRVHGITHHYTVLHYLLYILPALEFIIAPHYDMNKAGIIHSITSSSVHSHPPYPSSTFSILIPFLRYSCASTPSGCGVYTRLISDL